MTTRRYYIQNVNGQYWTGSCWGSKQAKELYLAQQLPFAVSDNSGKSFVYWENCLTWPVDAGYGDEPFARIYLHR